MGGTGLLVVSINEWLHGLSGTPALGHRGQSKVTLRYIVSGPSTWLTSKSFVEFLMVIIIIIIIIIIILFCSPSLEILTGKSLRGDWFNPPQWERSPKVPSICPGRISGLQELLTFSHQKGG